MATRVELVYGRSGTGKSTWAIKLAKWFFYNKGLRTRLYIADGGIETYEAEGLIEDGIIEAWQINKERGKAFYTCAKACEGYWPEDPRASVVKLVKPNYTAYAEKFGLTIFEGLTFMSDWQMEDLSGRAARGEKIGQDTPWTLQDGEEKWGSNPPAHYGFVQRRMEDNIERSRMLPGWVQWTAHERKAEDKELGARETMFGPDVVGSALTTKIGAHFGNTIHLHPIKKLIQKTDEVTKKPVDTEEVHYRAYTRTHYDPMQRHYIMYYANSRVPSEFRDMMPEYLEPPDPIRFYQILEDAKAKRRATMENQNGQKNSN